ncbi:PD-(D/E)XK nuclease family protein [Brevundimonas sp. SH203]|uniref:PDDEXK-like family protein n=1 Tax=Brevundimonas sp. SH203 TaxID=345167 RepID=UPI0013566D88|nr:PD-(D/E)XK nuclease family protein [Brevundimonas sp. SH203]
MSEAALTDNLQALFSKMQALEPAPITHRLARFFEDWRSLQRASVSNGMETAVAPVADADALRCMFERLRPLLDQNHRSAADLNIWAVSRLGTDEIRTSAVLAWFLDPSGSHGEGRLFADALWSAVGADLGFNLRNLRRTATEVCPLADAADRVDVVLEGDDFAVFIEVKIYAGLQPAQLERYAAAAERSASLRDKAHAALIYLAPYPTRLPSERCRWLSWRSLARAFRLAAEKSGTPFVRQATDQFAQHIERLR